jgi:hypothetical protein
MQAKRLCDSSRSRLFFYNYGRARQDWGDFELRTGPFEHEGAATRHVIHLRDKVGVGAGAGVTGAAVFVDSFLIFAFFGFAVAVFGSFFIHLIGFREC